MEKGSILEFADLYIDGKIDLPVMSSLTSLFNLYDSSSLSTDLKKRMGQIIKVKISELDNIKALDKLNLSPKTKAEILKALYELTQAIFSRQGHLKKLNKEITKKRQDTIRHLKKTLDYPLLPYKDTIQKTLDMLKELNDPKTYHPIKELDFIKTAVIGRPLLGDITGSFHVERNKKLFELLSRPLKFESNRPSVFFLRVLQIVVFKHLKKTKIENKEAHQHTADIINEFFKKTGHKKQATLKAKDIKNTLYNCS